MSTKKAKTGRIVAGIVPWPLIETVDKLHAKGYTDTEIVKMGVRLVGKQEKVAA